MIVLVTGAGGFIGRANAPSFEKRATPIGLASGGVFEAKARGCLRECGE